MYTADYAARIAGPIQGASIGGTRPDDAECPRAESHLEMGVSQARKLHAQLVELEHTLIRLIEKIEGPAPQNTRCEEKDQDPPGLLGQLAQAQNRSMQTLERMMQATEHLQGLL